MLTLFHDPTDPASAVAVARCTRLAEEGVPIEFEGFDALGLDLAMPVDLGMLALIGRLQEEAAAEGIVLNRPSGRPPSALAHVLMHRTEGTPVAHPVRHAVYQAYWEDDADIGDAAVLTEVAAAAGANPDTVADLLADRVALASRRREMGTHRREGVGGVPVVLASRTLIPGLLDEQAIRDLAAAV
ncbi:DsbA family oxidoreductase [Euzebya tangerina]|uniref:DsbA family oxidoreductase n=1 Tax=Euzebya tangerina TaxID=591198 RepID=UPI000E3178D5|nr:DsbA family protein [Euzebya tangerina]